MSVEELFIFFYKLSVAIVIFMFMFAYILTIATLDIRWYIKKMHLALGVLVYYIAYNLDTDGVMFLFYYLSFALVVLCQKWQIDEEQKSLNDEVTKANKRIIELGAS